MSPLPTLFAPAERADPQEVLRQHLLFAAQDLPAQLGNAVPDLLMILNQERQIVFANHELSSRLGLAAEEMLGQRPGEVLDCTHAHDGPGGCGTSEACQNCGLALSILASQNGQPAVQDGRLSVADGEALDVRAWSTPITVNGEPFTIFVLTDISADKRRRALERIFFHDVLNTAGGLRGYASLLESAPPSEVNLIRESIYHLSNRLIDEIQSQRELSAAEANELEPHFEPLNPRGVLRQVLEIYRKHDTAEGKTLQLDAGSQSVSGFESDPVLLRRVLGNLVKNALEATREGETITVGCRPTGPQAAPEGVEFWVRNPAFMPRAVQLQIFQRSFTTKGSGRGLGTYSIKLLSERYLGGSVSFTSDEGEGTKFVVKLPMKGD
jgi:signal transduction histidine kinase